jgi:DNA-binding MarR family transcriptional regulator
MIIGAIHSDWVEDPVTQRTSTRTAVATASLKCELLLSITFSTGFIVAPVPSNQLIASINECYHASAMKASRDEVRSMVTALFVTNAALDRARRQKKGASTLSLLQVVATTPGIRPSEIANAQDVHPSQVTRQVRELETVRFVQVMADPADRRSCQVTLTPSGVEELQRLTEVGLDRFGSFVEDWEPEEVRMLTSLLQKLEQSKAEVAAQQRPHAGRRWARQDA